MDRNDTQRFSFYVIVFWNKIAPLFLRHDHFRNLYYVDELF